MRSDPLGELAPPLPAAAVVVTSASSALAKRPDQNRPPNIRFRCSSIHIRANKCGSTYGWFVVETSPLPEQPELRGLAQALEDIGAAAEILDHKWRVVFTSSEDALALGLDPGAMRHHYGLSLVVRPQQHPDWVTDQETGSRWWRAVGPHMVGDVPPDDPDFDAVFGPLARRARGGPRATIARRRRRRTGAMVHRRHPHTGNQRRRTRRTRPHPGHDLGTDHQHGSGCKEAATSRRRLTTPIAQGLSSSMAVRALADRRAVY